MIFMTSTNKSIKPARVRKCGDSYLLLPYLLDGFLFGRKSMLVRYYGIQPMRQSKPRLGVHLTRVYQCLSESVSIGDVPKSKPRGKPRRK
jgi:hypothetical protein